MGIDGTNTEYGVHLLSWRGILLKNKKLRQSGDLYAVRPMTLRPCLATGLPFRAILDIQLFHVAEAMRP